jgi:gliding motility-associated-like protein
MMQIQQYKSLLILLLLFSAFAFRAKASHSVALDLQYEYAGQANTYTITLKFYFDCSSSVSMGNTEYIDYDSDIYGYTGTKTLDLISGPVEVDQPCLPGETNCTNPNSPYIGVYEYVYEGTLTLPYASKDWVISYTGCCRNYAISTVTSPGSKDYYVSALLNSVDAPENNSPYFQALPVPQLCVGNHYDLSQKAVEVDGDSLVYSLMEAEEGPYPGVSMLADYISPYTPTYPISSSSGFTIDVEGNLSFTPNLEQMAIVCILVEEYRYDTVFHIWEKVGSIKRDMQMIVIADCLDDSEFYYLTVSPDPNNPDSVIQANCMDTVITIYTSDSIQCGSISTDGSDFRMLNPLGDPIPVISAVAVDCYAGYTNVIQITLGEPMNQNGTYSIWTKIGYDQNSLITFCGFQLAEFDTLTINVDSCPDLRIDLRNVTVLENDSIGMLWNLPYNAYPMVDWKPIFKQYNIYRSLLPAGIYDYIGSNYDMYDTTYVDHDVYVQSKNYNYNIAVELTNTYASPQSDSIQSILLSCGEKATDSTQIYLEWTEYWGWDNPEYVVYHAAGADSWAPIGTTTLTNYSFDKPVDADDYRVKVAAFYEINDSITLISESNWCEYSIPLYAVNVPNVFSPNGDGINDNLVFEHLEQYHYTHLRIFNRWGRKVYENENYENDWDGDRLVGGTYFYVLEYTDGTSEVGTITLIR